MSALGRPTISYSPKEMLLNGLQIAGFERRNIKSCRSVTNLRRFKDFYGSLPVVYCKIYDDLQITHNAEARIDPQRCDIDRFLLGINFLKVYGLENHRAALFKMHPDTCRKWAWYVVEKLQALKAEKVSFLADCQKLFWLVVRSFCQNLFHS